MSYVSMNIYSFSFVTFSLYVRTLWQYGLWSSYTIALWLDDIKAFVADLGLFILGKEGSRMYVHTVRTLWREHSTLTFENLKPVENSKKSSKKMVKHTM